MLVFTQKSSFNSLASSIMQIFSHHFFFFNVPGKSILDHCGSAITLQNTIPVIHTVTINYQLHTHTQNS